MQRKYSLRFGGILVAPVQFAADMVSWKQQKRGEKSPLDGGKRMVQKPGEYAEIVVSQEEYEQFKSQQARISELEQQVNALTEALRHSTNGSAHPARRPWMTAASS